VVCVWTTFHCNPRSSGIPWNHDQRQRKTSRWFGKRSLLLISLLQFVLIPIGTESTSYVTNEHVHTYVGLMCIPFLTTCQKVAVVPPRTLHFSFLNRRKNEQRGGYLFVSCFFTTTTTTTPLNFIRTRRRGIPFASFILFPSLVVVDDIDSYLVTFGKGRFLQIPILLYSLLLYRSCASPS